MLYREHCARCHGEDARGEGPEAAQLQFRPADLTGLRRRAGGQFPAERVARTIDGRRPLPGHGGTDMPVWGDVMKDSRERYDEAAVRARITSIVKYLETVQEPARR
jgi:mono/diheme cytochrome c family protein